MCSNNTTVVEIYIGLICYIYRPLSDLPQAPAADSISQDSFQTQYLTPLLGKEAHVIIAFLQDKVLRNVAFLVQFLSCQ